MFWRNWGKSYLPFYFCHRLLFIASEGDFPPLSLKTVLYPWWHVGLLVIILAFIFGEMSLFHLYYEGYLRQIDSSGFPWRLAWV